ncbi:RICIN domain-containing protein [Streptomyces sp. QTS52]
MDLPRRHQPAVHPPRGDRARHSHDYQLVAVNSGKCVDVSEISTAAGALVHQWTCDAASALTTKKNQIWRLLGKA